MIQCICSVYGSCGHYICNSLSVWGGGGPSCRDQKEERWRWPCSCIPTFKSLWRLNFSYIFICPVLTIHFPITNPLFLQAMPISARHLGSTKKRKTQCWQSKHRHKRKEGGFSWQLVPCQTVLRVRLIHRCSLHCHHKSCAFRCKLHQDKRSVGSCTLFWLKGNNLAHKNHVKINLVSSINENILSRDDWWIKYHIKKCSVIQW